MAKEFSGTTEEWLTLAAHWLVDDVILPETKGREKPLFRVHVGWPKGTSNRKKNLVLGACYKRLVSPDNHNEVFIAPTIDTGEKALSTLLHEMIHATDDCESGHRGFFRRTALAVGLTGKMTATMAGPDLTEALKWWIEENGDMPTPAMKDLPAKGGTQSTRMHKLVCGSCGFTARASMKWINQLSHSGNTCPACGCDALDVYV